MDPYASYQPGFDPPYGIDDPIEIYDEGIDSYGDDSLYISDDFEPDDFDGGYDYEYDEIYEGEGEELFWDDDIIYADGDWLPVLPEEIPLETLPIGDRPGDYGSQLLIGGLEHPDPALMRDSYCQFYPDACAEGAGLGGREPYNRTEVAEELDRTLKDIDMTGLAIAAVLLLILLFGLHYGGASDTPEPAADRPPRGRSEAEKKYDDALKAGGITDDTERAKALKEIMAKKTDPERKDKLSRLIAAKAGGGEDPDKAKYKKRLEDAGIKEPALSKNLEKIMKEDKGEKRSKKCKDIIDAHKAKTSGVVADPNMAGYKQRLEDAGYSGDELTAYLAKIAKMTTDEKKEAEVKRLEDKKKKKEETPPSGDVAKKPYTPAELDAKLKEMGYTDDADRKKKVDSLAQRSRATQDTKLAEWKNAKTASNANKAKADELNKQLEAAGMKSKTERAAKVKELLPKNGAEQAAEIKKIKDANDAAKVPRDALDAELKAAGYTDDKDRKAKVDALLKLKEGPARDAKLAEYKGRKKGSAGGPTAEPAASGKGTKDGSGGKGESVVPPAGNAVPPLDEAAIKKKLAEKGYTDPGAIKNITDAVMAKKPEDRQKELEKYTAISRPERKAAEKKAASEQKKKDAAGPPSKDPPPGGTAPGGGSSNSADTADTPPVGSSAKPQTEEGLRAALKRRKYSDPVIEEMVKAHKAAGNDAAKLALEKDLLSKDQAQIAANKEKYKPKTSTDPPTKDKTTPSTTAINTAEDLDKALASAGYSEPARKNMVKAWERETDPKKRQAMEASYLKPDNLATYEAKCKGAGGTPAADVPITDEEAKLRANLMANDKAKYDPETINNMIKKWKETPVEKRKDLEKKLTSVRSADIAANKKEYGKKADEISATGAGAPAVDEEVNLRQSLKANDKAKYDPETIENMVKKWKETPADKRKDLEKKLKSERSADIAANKKHYGKTPSDTGLVAGTPEHRAKMDQRLKDQGYDDKDARDEILDEIIKTGGTAKEQEENLEKKYAGRSEASRRKENKKKGDERRARKAGNTAFKLPSDDEILDQLKTAGWSDPDARQYLLKQIKEADSDAAKKRALDSYVKSGRGTPEDNKKYGDRWRKDNPTTQLSAADQAIDDKLKAKKYSPEARQNMIKELNAEKDPKKRKEKLDKWLAADPNAVEGTNKIKGKPAARAPGDSANPDDPWLTGPQLALLLLLLIPLMIVLSRGDVSMPTGESFVRFPSVPGMAAIKGPWASPVVVGGVPVSTGLPDLTSRRSVRRRSSSSSSRPRLTVRPSKADSGGPSININNVNAQGSGIPIDIDSSIGGGGIGGDGVVGAIAEETVVIETGDTEYLEEPVVVVAEAVAGETTPKEDAHIPIIEVIAEDPITIELQGPSDPNRLFWMLISLLAISFPLLLDYMADWPTRTSSDTVYLSAMMHWLILGIAIVFLFLKLDRAYSWSTRYGRPIIHYARRLPQYVTPVVVGTVEGTEAFIWGVDDALFGSSQELLGLALAAGAFCILAMTKPYDSGTKGEYSEGAGQLMPVVGAAIVTFLFFNAWAGAY